MELFPDLKSAWILIGENQPIEGMESTNGEVGINQPIPDNKPNTKTDIINTPISPKGEVVVKTISSKKIKGNKKLVSLEVDEMLLDNPGAISEELIQEWITYRKKPITKRVWQKTNEVMQKLLAEHGMQPRSVFERMLEKQWQGMEESYYQDLIDSKKKTISNQDMNYTLGLRSEFGF
jgi:DNA-binding protein YbaB